MSNVENMKCSAFVGISLDGSVQSFEDSMRRTVERIEILQHKIHAFKRSVTASSEYTIDNADAAAD